MFIQLETKKFATEFSEVIGNLISYVENLESSKWNALLPQKIFSSKKTKGFCLRTDMVLTNDGVKLTEMDYVALGRSNHLVLLQETHKREFLQMFKNWYESVVPGYTVYVATNPKSGPDCEEMELFCQLYNEYFAGETSVKLVACVKEETFKEMITKFEQGEKVWLDRMGYQYELPCDLAKCDSSLNQSRMDSKMVFALVHDKQEEESLLKAMSKQQLEFLRKVFPETYSLTDLKQQKSPMLDQILKSKNEWVLKNAAVENETAWGSQGVCIGFQHSEEEWASLVAQPPAFIGDYPIIQRFQQSMNFKALWERAIEEKVQYVSAGTPVGGEFMFGRATHFFCVVPGKFAEAAKIGYIDLRNDPKTHYTPDSLGICYQPV